MVSTGCRGEPFGKVGHDMDPLKFSEIIERIAYADAKAARYRLLAVGARIGIISRYRNSIAGTSTW
jgi:hypothetical protein